MALQSISPKYQKWIKGINENNVDNYILELKRDFGAITSNILYTNKSDEEIDKKITDLRKRLLYIQLYYNILNNKPTEENISILSDMQSDMILINKYEERNILLGQKRSLDTLTYISIIFLPLTLIASYFGMNFYSMGASDVKRGVLGVSYGQTFVFMLGILSVIGTVVFLKYYENKFRFIG